MSATVIGLAVLAALLHATWNACLRTGTDRLWTVTMMSISGTLVAVPFTLCHTLPSASAWPFVVLSACLQVGYSLFLVAAYERGELGQIYPIVRGSVPLLVTLGGFGLAGQFPTASQLVGVALVAVGIMSLSLGQRRAATSSILYAFATGVLIASYATVDAIGVRMAGGAGSYTAWVLVLYGVLLPATFALCRGPIRADLRSPETLMALAGGLVALTAYALVLLAFTLGPAGPITAIRETSVVFAALIGRLFLGEALPARRLVACTVVTLGAVCLSYP